MRPQASYGVKGVGVDAKAWFVATILESTSWRSLVSMDVMLGAKCWSGWSGQGMLTSSSTRGAILRSSVEHASSALR